MNKSELAVGNDADFKLAAFLAGHQILQQSQPFLGLFAIHIDEVGKVSAVPHHPEKRILQFRLPGACGLAHGMDISGIHLRVANDPDFGNAA